MNRKQSLTPEAIELMGAGSDMDVLVAELVMGWKAFEHQPSESSRYYTNARVVCRMHCEGVWPDGRRERTDFKPSCEIAHAMEIASRHQRFTLATFDGFLWTCGMSWERVCQSDASGSGQGTSPALAICRAALMAVIS